MKRRHDASRRLLPCKGGPRSRRLSPAMSLCEAGCRLERAQTVVAAACSDTPPSLGNLQGHQELHRRTTPDQMFAREDSTAISNLATPGK